jgi:hypothetical protein
MKFKAFKTNNMSNKDLQQWEYLIEYNDNAGGFSSKIKINGVVYTYAEEVNYLNEKGKQGWELVQAPTHGNAAYYFKRPKQQP